MIPSLRSTKSSFHRRAAPPHRPQRSLSYALHFAIFAVTILAPEARATKGLNLIENDAFMAGMRGGATALVQTPAAARYNPANLSLVGTSAVEVTSTLIYISSEFTAPSGAKTKTKSPYKPVGGMFAATPIGSGAVTLGFGLDVPFGSSRAIPPRRTATCG
jgi:hypothetical protein